MEVVLPQPETADLNEQRRYDLQTQFAELVDGSMRTNFELTFNGHDLIGEDGRSLDETTRVGLEDAKEIVKTKPNLWFEVRRRSLERDEFQEVVEMARGRGPNTKVVISDFPHELVSSRQDVGGYNVTRKQAMMRVFIRQADGSMRMFSKSLDGSNRHALEAIYEHLDHKAEAGELLGQRISGNVHPNRQSTLVEELTGVYDRDLSTQFGGDWYAGRRPADYRNTYDFVCRQSDIINECLRLDNLGWLNETILYNMAATMQKRFETSVNQVPNEQMLIGNQAGALNMETAMITALHQEAEAAGQAARFEGRTFSACGSTLGINGMTANGFGEAGYGNKAELKDCEFVSKKCPVCGEKNVKTKVKRGKYYHVGKNCAA